MRQHTVALNYAEALYALAEADGSYETYWSILDALASAIEQAPRVQAVLMSPRVPKDEKAALLTEALGDAPRPLILFLNAVVKRGRQGLLREIVTAYQGLVDIKFNRVRADVTLAREADDELRRTIQQALERLLTKDVIARYHTDPAILGGAIVRVGDRVYDGSVRRRATMLRRQLLQA